MSRSKASIAKSKSKPRTLEFRHGKDRAHAPAALTPPPPPPPKRLDLGCGPNKKEGFYGIDQYSFPTVDLVFDLGDRAKPWPFADGQIEEVHCSHFLEHLTSDSRIHFMNELHRVLMPGGKALIIVPYWGSSRAYGDPTHVWPPIGEMAFYYYEKAWRANNALHTDISWNPLGFSCDFIFQCGYSIHQKFQTRTLEVQEFAVTFYKEAAQDIIGTLTKPLQPR